MAHASRVDQYGNPVLRVDEYGNPIHDQPGYTAGGHAAHGVHGAGEYGTTQPQMHATGVQHQPQVLKDDRAGAGTGGVLHRSGSSSSSSSSEDDGMGGRRKKKGIKEKIKEKLPGGHKTNEPHTTTQTTTPAATTTPAGPGGAHYGQEHEKKGIMDKIKEKLPGSH